VAGNSDLQDGSHPDISGGVNPQFSLIGTKTGTNLAEANPGPDPDTGNKIGGPLSGVLDPRLAPLANNGGPTQTHALCTGPSTPHASCTGASPALNAGSNALIPADAADLDGDGNTAEPLPFDQRGFARIFNATVDMGAFEVQPMHPWHNNAKPLDVVGSGTVTPDGQVVAGDALAIINYINAFGAGTVPAGAAVGQPYGFLDTSDDNNVAPNDALDVINAINAGQGGEGESMADQSRVSRSAPVDQPPVTNDQPSLTVLIDLLALDLAVQQKRRTV
jgi:Dockerin type I domain